MKCLFDRAEKLVTTEEDMLNEKEHLSNVLERNDYPRSFVCSSTTHHPEVKEKTTDSNEVRIIIPYTKGISEDIRRVCRSYGITTCSFQIIKNYKRATYQSERQTIG